MLDELHAMAITIVCRYCGAGRGEVCRNKRTDPPTPTRIPHAQRLRESQEVPF